MVFSNLDKLTAPQQRNFSSPGRLLFYILSHLSALQSCALIFHPIFSLFSHLNSAKHNLVVKLCRALKIIQTVLRLFSRFAQSFVAIELLTYFKNSRSHFIFQESSQYLGFKNSIRKQDYFLFL